MDREKRKEQILECAKRLFAEHGYYQTQISDIIRDANIARGTFYRYFTNKKDIFLTLLENFYERWVSEVSLKRKMIDLETISPEAHFRHRVHQSLQFFAGDPHLSRIFLRMGLGLPPDMEDTIRRLENQILELVEKDLKLGIKNNHIPADIDVTVTANLLIGATLRISYYYFAEPAKQGDAPRDIEAMTDAICRIVLPGLFPG